MSARFARLLRLLLLSWLMVLGPAASFGAPSEGPRTLPTNRSWDVLEPPRDEAGQRAALRQAARELRGWDIHLAGVRIEAAKLMDLAQLTPDEPLVRVMRESLRRPLDVGDFLLLLDDVLLAGRAGRRGERIWITPGRARKAGVLLHPDDVFEVGKPRRYGERGSIAIDRPEPQKDLPAARDGDLLGPNWTMRYQNPKGEAELLGALERERPGAEFGERIAELMEQLRRQGADVYLNSTVRSRERGYLMWGAFELGRIDDPAAGRAMVDRLRGLNAEWGLAVDIEWMHPEGSSATREAAREMADTYEVVFATESGARSSNHYSGMAVDLVAVGLPRVLVLESPSGERRRFDLSRPDEPRDLSLSPELIDWIEHHFGLEKVASDYPHWNDARGPMRGETSLPAAGTSR